MQISPAQDFDFQNPAYIFSVKDFTYRLELPGGLYSSYFAACKPRSRLAHSKLSYGIPRTMDAKSFRESHPTVPVSRSHFLAVRVVDNFNRGVLDNE